MERSKLEGQVTHLYQVLGKADDAKALPTKDWFEFMEGKCRNFDEKDLIYAIDHLIMDDKYGIPRNLASALLKLMHSHRGSRVSTETKQFPEYKDEEVLNNNLASKFYKCVNLAIALAGKKLLVYRDWVVDFNLNVFPPDGSYESSEWDAGAGERLDKELFKLTVVRDGYRDDQGKKKAIEVKDFRNPRPIESKKPSPADKEGGGTGTEKPDLQVPAGAPVGGVDRQGVEPSVKEKQRPDW